MTRLRPVSTRQSLLLGVSAAALIFSSSIPALAQDAFRRAPRDPAAQAAQAAAARATQNQAASTATRRTIEAFSRAAQARQQMDAAQAAARAQAMAAQVTVPNGLGAGGLQAANGVSTDPSLWIGAGAPTQTTADGRTRVEVDQTQSKAILSWDSFNVGRETDLVFDQQGNSSWAVLNRVTDVNADPSRILGSIKADGTVMILNRNGVIFTGSSQVNARNIVAAAADLSNERFLASGIYSAKSGNDYVPNFTAAGGPITVHAGAQLTTTAPKTVLEGGGYVMLLGTSVENAGSIVTPKGQTLLGAGDAFVVRPGFGTDGNVASTTRGNEVRGLIDADSLAGTVINSGSIDATRGDITLTGRNVLQNGIAIATTSVSQRGTIHLSTSATDTEGQVTLGGNSLTAILPELDSDDTATNAQRDTLAFLSEQNLSAKGQFDNLSHLSDRGDQSRVEIVSGGTLSFATGSTTLAQGGQIAASAQTITTQDGAILDVSGVRGVAIDINSNAIKVNIQGNELRDSPLNRDQPFLKSQDVWIDARDLVLVPAGTDGYATDRYYTGGGLLEVGGQLANTPHTIGEWAAIGGTITLAANEVDAQSGSVFNIAGGSIDYSGGGVLSTRLQGVDGKLYDINDAPAGMQFISVGRSQTVDHKRWGPQYAEVYSNAMFNRGAYIRQEESYTVGRDGGKLVLSTPNALFDGEIDADTVAGTRQNQARPAGIGDGYKATQNSAALAGSLALVDASGDIGPGTRQLASDIVFSNAARPEDLTNTSWLNADLIISFGLGGLTTLTTGDLRVDDALVLSHGSRFDLGAGSADLTGDLTARAGSVTVTTIGEGGITLRAGAAIDTRGVWTNGALDPFNLASLAYINGGSVSLRSSEDVTLEAGSSIDASSGGALLANGGSRSAVGGDIKLAANTSLLDLPGLTIVSQSGKGGLMLGGEIRAYGVTRGGNLTLETAGVVVIGDGSAISGGSLAAGTPAPVDVTLAQDLTIAAGGILVLPLDQITDQAPLGKPLGEALRPLQPQGGQPVVTGADWRLPDYPFDLAIIGDTGFFQGGNTVPAGTKITFFGGSGVIPAGTVIPAEVFPNGLKVQPYTVTLPAGAITPTTVTLAAGTVLPAGARLTETVAIVAPRPIDPALFGSGFASYNVNAQQGLLVAPGTKIDAVQPVYRLSASSPALATGADPATAMELWTPPTYVEDPVTATLTQRAGADISLLSGINPTLNGFATGGSVAIGDGASITVDPGRSVKIASGGQITVDGAIHAPGGVISIVNNRPLGGALQATNFDPGALSIWIGEHGILDAAARAYTALDRQGRRYGVVPDGGSILLGNEGGIADHKNSLATDAYIVIRPGALVDASGASTTLDPAAGLINDLGVGSPSLVASDGGAITLRSFSGLHLDGDLRAASGGGTSSGGALSLILETPIYYTGTSGSPSGVPDGLQGGRILTIGQMALAELPADLQPGQRDETLNGSASGRYSANQIEAGGFDSVSLWSRNAIVFDGDVTLRTGRSIALYQGALYNSVAGGNVTLDAPYVLLSGKTDYTNTDYNFIPSALPTLPAGGRFSATADLLDVADTVATFFDDTALTSRHDLRFVAASTVASRSAITTLRASGNLNLTAQQLYPTSGAVVDVIAGYARQFNQPVLLPDKVLTIASIDGIDPGVPYSVFGRINFAGSTIRQGGIVRAPLGSINLGKDIPFRLPAVAGVTELLAGSITSISAAGLTIPYGGTADGVVYRANGDVPFTWDLVSGFLSLGSDAGSIRSQAGITLGGAVAVAPGATLDMSGGGTLAGAAFVTGRGGSTDTLLNPMNPGGKVYALIPGVATAPLPGGAADVWAGAAPGIGQQITIPAGVPGLAAGTYTLLPANYALLPGAFRVELDGAGNPAASGIDTLPNGSYVLNAIQGVANTTIRDSLPTSVTITPGSTVRTYSQYNEQGYADFQIAQATLFGKVRPLLPMDARSLTIATDSLDFAGKATFAPAKDGISGSLIINKSGNLVITGPDSATPGISTADIDAIGAPNLFIGAGIAGNASNSANQLWRGDIVNLTIEGGATLKAAQIVLNANTITIGDGAVLSTIGQGAPGYDSASTGALFGSDSQSAIALSNGKLLLLGAPDRSGAITIAEGASLYTEGSLGFITSVGVTFGGVPQIGARDLTLSVPSINIGGADALAAAASNGVLPAGVLFDQALLDKLLSGDPSSGAPALQSLALTASKSVNFYGSVDLDTRDPVTGKSRLDQFVLNTPAIYGLGSANDTVHLVTDTLVWNGTVTAIPNTQNPIQYTSAAPAAVLANGPGTGAGKFDIQARRIVLGYPDPAQPDGLTALDRLVLGFSDVTLDAAERITSNGRGSLAVFRSGSIDDVGVLTNAAGGSLTLTTPLLTGAAGSAIIYTTGGALTVAPPAGASASTARADTLDALGAEIGLNGDSVTLSSAVVLPSGKLTVGAVGDIVLADGSRTDLSGQAIKLFDVTRYSWGGDAIFESLHGDILLAQGALLDLSATGSDAGTLTLSALDAAAGRITLSGILAGKGGDGFEHASIDMRAQRIGADPASLTADFAALNGVLDSAGFSGGRSFAFKQGDLAIGDGLRAHQIAVSLDGGSLTVTGTLDASGTKPGTIRLAARDDLTLAGTAVLDTHGTVLQVDGRGDPIEAQNQGRIELTSVDGTLTLASGATLDLHSADGVARGRVDLNAGRTGEMSGDIRIAAAGPLAIQGAQSVAVNAFWTYSPTDAAGTIVQDNGGVTPIGADGSVGLNQIDGRSGAFIDAAWTNTELQSRLAGLSASGSAFHLRPGVEIVSAGDLTVKGDLDLSGYRYGPNADRDPASAGYGAGEAGSFVVRAGGDLSIKGSITDGFAPPPLTPDDNGWGTPLPTGQINEPITFTGGGITLAAGSNLPADGIANFEFETGDFTEVRPGAALPTDISISYAYLPAGSTLSAPIYNGDGTTLYPAGTVLEQDLELFSGEKFGAGFVLGNNGYLALAPTAWAAGTDLAIFNGSVSLGTDTSLPAGTTIPAGAYLQYVGSALIPTREAAPDGTQGRIYAIAPMLAPGSQSWSMRLVGGADTASADTRGLTAKGLLGDAGNLTLSDEHRSASSGTPIFSVVRTGIGDLDLLAGGNISQDSLYGIYTAGTQTVLPQGNDAYTLARPVFADDGAGTILGDGNQAYEDVLALIGTQAWFPDHGGDLHVTAQGSLTGNIYRNREQTIDNMAVGNWLWRQGGAELGQNAAWSINFGSYRPYSSYDTGSAVVGVSGFIGIGTLGGGNATIVTGGDAGNIALRTQYGSAQGTGLIAAVAGSGRVTSVDAPGGVVTGGTLVQTGGGDLTIRIGGRLNPAGGTRGSEFLDYNGVFTDTRGALSLDAGSVGTVSLSYAGQFTTTAPVDPRAIDPFVPTYVDSSGGIVLVPGDGKAVLRTRSDLVLGGAADPGIVDSWFKNAASLAADPGTSGQARSWFTLWQPTTALSLFSAGGNFAIGSINADRGINTNYYDDNIGYMLPPSLSVIAASGDIYPLGRLARELAPSPVGQLELLAGGSIFGGRINISGAEATPDVLPNPFKPAFVLEGDFGSVVTNNTNGYEGLFAFEFDTVTGALHVDDREPVRIYAGEDIIDFRTGRQTQVYDLTTNVPLLANVAAKAVQVRAGRDLVAFGGYDAPSVFLNTDPNDVSVLSAGRDILYANVKVGGPGLLDVSAGRNLYQGGHGFLESLGALYDAGAQGLSSGAGITLSAGMGSQGPDYEDFARLYFDPANQSSDGRIGAGDEGKVFKSYDKELAAWLKARFGYAGSGADAIAYYHGLPTEQQGIFARQVYFEELRQGGREYNNPDSLRFQSYVRGRQAIATLFPDKDASGNVLTYAGDITVVNELFTDQYTYYTQTSGVRTNFGGGIELLAPGGSVFLGTEGGAGAPPGLVKQIKPDYSGVLTQGAGNIDVFSKGSILLGLSRVFTTFGGGITMWSVEGDINAGRGARGTVVYAPVRRIYDQIGNVSLSPTVPTSGAGIGTLNPIPEVQAGDIDLIAPLGTIDAGEAGIRVSGNVNLAALHILNAANIEVQGEATGIPQAAAVNTGALTAASAANNAVVAEATRLAERTRPEPIREMPTILNVRFLGFGPAE